jgi:spore germination protein KA
MLILMVAHLCSLRSFGIPYLSPLAPFILEDQKDVFIRFPYWAMSKRPKYMETEKGQKAKPTASPSPPPMKGE